MKKLGESRNFLYSLLFVSILIDFFLRTFLFILMIILLLQIILAYGIINKKSGILKISQHIVALIILLTIPELFFTYQTFLYVFPNENILIILLPDFILTAIRDCIVIYAFSKRNI